MSKIRNIEKMLQANERERQLLLELRAVYEEQEEDLDMGDILENDIDIDKKYKEIDENLKIINERNQELLSMEIDDEIDDNKMEIDEISSQSFWTINTIELIYPCVEKELNPTGLCNIQKILMTYNTTSNSYMLSIEFFDYNYQFELYNTHTFPATRITDTTHITNKHKWSEMNDVLERYQLPFLNQIQIQPQTQKVNIYAHTPEYSDEELNEQQYILRDIKMGYYGLPIEGYYHVNWIRPNETENNENEKKCIENVCHYLKKRFDSSNPLNIDQPDEYYEDDYGIHPCQMEKYRLQRWLPC